MGIHFDKELTQKRVCALRFCCYGVLGMLEPAFLLHFYVAQVLTTATARCQREDQRDKLILM